MHLPVDERTIDRLISGEMAPDDAPPGYARLASLVGAAQGPGSPGELAGEGAVAVMAAAVVSNTLVPAAAHLQAAATRSKRNKMLSKVLTAKAATAATVALFGLGTAAAAATGALPVQGSNAPSQGTTASLSISTSPTSGTQSGTTGTTDQSSVTSGATGTAGGTSGINAPMTGPANQHALFGLCTAFLAGSGGATGGKDSSTAFVALIKEAGGSVGSTTTACTTYLQNASSSAGTSSDASGSTDAPAAHGSGRPASPGHSGTHQGHGHGHGSH